MIKNDKKHKTKSFFKEYKDCISINAEIMCLNAQKGVFKAYIILWNNIFHFHLISCIIHTLGEKMACKEIEIRKDEEFITLNVLLKIADIIPTGGMAKIFLQNNVVLVNDEEENRRGRKLYRGDVIKIGKQSFIIK